MILKKVILTLLLIHLISLTTIWSQLNFFPAGAKWYFGFNVGGLVQARGYTEYVYTGDVLLSGKLSKRIARTSYYFDYQNPTTPIDTIVNNALYLTQCGDSVLYYNFRDTSYKLLWKINVIAGDQFEVEDQWQLFTMKVDSVASVQIENQNVQKIWIEGDSDFGLGGETVIYDKFGPENGFFYYTCWGKYDCYPPTICRYYSDDTGEINFSNPVCNILATAVSPFTEADIRIYPNPCITSFTVALTGISKNNAALELININGELLESFHAIQKDEQVVEMSDYSPGVYFCKIRLENQFQVYKIIKL